MHQSGLHGEKGPVQVYGQHGVPIRQSHLVERLFRPHGGIVDEDVEAAKALDGRRDQPFDGGRIAHVGQYRERLSARGGDVGGDGLDGLAITPAIDHHGRTRRGKRQGNGTADVAAPARNQGYTSLKITAAGHDGVGLIVVALKCCTKDVVARQGMLPARARAHPTEGGRSGVQALPCG
jgi:hypothetical protein